MRSGRGLVAAVVAIRRLLAGLHDALAKALQQLPGAMGEDQRRLGALPVEPAVDLPDPLVHLIGGSHARQGEIQPVGRPFLHQTLGENQRRLGLTGTGHVLQQKQLRPGLQLRRRGIVL
ncbi:hypothetical protein FQZ97_965920 [compost metagenome]